jgi:hypothetical protein
MTLYRTGGYVTACTIPSLSRLSHADTMKSFVAIVVCLLVASAAAFTPLNQNQVRVSSVARQALADSIFGMDLFDPDQNKYGARAKKNLDLKKLGSNSYIPAGLTKAQYEAVRAKDTAAKKARYQKNVSKAGKFQGYDQFYLKRGTDLNQGWKKSATLGHDMAKTKFDWTGKTDVAKKFESTTKVDEFKTLVFGRKK